VFLTIGLFTSVFFYFKDLLKRKMMIGFLLGLKAEPGLANSPITLNLINIKINELEKNKVFREFDQTDGRKFKD